ncbi:class I SAM-dependent methyltransferase [Paenibacillus kobensis]|uniref:class I SAM-dependent methyltransferase n=1 Tax=Paenibacillus kobensis TaxID=59841 RepID=UPI000FDC84B2|nr:class I SAM-dependent methyltransferase [Paenibacillus kobensis]
MEARLARIREEERLYHEDCYANHKLFEPGSWLHKPVQTVMRYWSMLDDRSNVKVLDLGSGVGRNSIPIAQSLIGRGGKVICVDLIDSALRMLERYSEQYGVSALIEPVQSDIGEYAIHPDSFDYMIAVSTLEHIASVEQLTKTLDRMRQGTVQGGLNVIIIGTNVEERDIATGVIEETMFEINLTTPEAFALLNDTYKGWTVLKQHAKPLSFSIARGQQQRSLMSDCITYVVQRSDRSEEEDA